MKDKNGKAVENLTAKDFSVTEDGVPQTIKFFEFQKLQDQPPAANPAPATRAVPLSETAQNTNRA